MNKGTYWTDTALPLLRSREFSFTDKLGLALGYKKVPDIYVAHDVQM